MRNGNLFIWMQHGHQRDAAKTVASIQSSDIRTNYTCVTDSNKWEFPRDYPKLQVWWEEQMLSTAKLAIELGCEYVLRLEDDIVVNKHIVHNIQTWSALADPSFGLGTLFFPDHWSATPWAFKKSEYSDSVYKDSIDVEGGQGQVYRAADMELVIPLTRRARKERGVARPTDCVSFDWSLTRALFLLRRRTFVHQPALVDIHRGSCSSLLSGPQDPEFHYWGHATFNSDWRRI